MSSIYIQTYDKNPEWCLIEFDKDGTLSIQRKEPGIDHWIIVEPKEHGVYIRHALARINGDNPPVCYE